MNVGGKQHMMDEISKLWDILKEFELDLPEKTGGLMNFP
jgi:hypothetical protein